MTRLGDVVNFFLFENKPPIGLTYVFRFSVDGCYYDVLWARNCRFFHTEKTCWDLDDVFKVKFVIIVVLLVDLFYRNWNIDF